MNPVRFIELACTNPVNRSILGRMPGLGLSDAWLVAGSLFQTVWNERTGRRPCHGIRDYDIFYFDPDVSWDAEDRVIGRCASAFGDLGVKVEVRNQARVHLWYRERFGADYPPLGCSTNAIDRFLAPTCMVGIAPMATGMQVYAPFGFGDVEALIVRPNLCPNFRADRYVEKAARWKQCWPELTVISAWA
jgi:hypothetical protein